MRAIDCSPVMVAADLGLVEPMFRFARAWYWIGRGMQMDLQYEVKRDATGRVTVIGGKRVRP